MLQKRKTLSVRASSFISFSMTARSPPTPFRRSVTLAVHRFLFLQIGTIFKEKNVGDFTFNESGAVRHQHINWLYLPTIEEPLRKMRKHFLGSSR